MQARLAAVLVLVGALCGCNKRPTFPPSLIDAYRVEAEQKLQALDRLGRSLRSFQLEKEADKLPVDGVRFATEDALNGKVSLSSTIPGAMPDGIIFDESVLGPEHKPNFDFELGERPYFVEDTQKWLALRDKKPISGVAEQAHQQFRRLLALRYVLVVRTSKIEWPAAETSSFKPGAFLGEALIFELAGDTPSFVGGFRFGGMNSESVKVRFEKNREYQKRAWLVTDLKYNVYRSLHERLLARAPGAKIPPTDWYKPTL